MVAIKKISQKKIDHTKTPRDKNILSRKNIYIYLKAAMWFGIGATLGLFFLLSFIFILFQQLYRQTVFPGVMVDGVNFGGKTQSYVENYFAQKNDAIKDSTFTFQYQDMYATVSARALQIGYNSTLLAKQAMSIGRSSDLFSNITLVFESYTGGTILAPSFTISPDNLKDPLSPLQKQIYVAPIDAQFQLVNGRVTTFVLSKDGQDIDTNALLQRVNQYIPLMLSAGKKQNITIPIPIKVLHPKITTEQVNNLGIKELIGTGTSLFQHSIPSRIYNVELAASRLNGVVVKPNEEFSFAKALGDVSAYTGYQQAYVISGGHTVLGDGGGVCQVSTTMFRAILDAGLPITERHAHDYRVGYYEEDGPPGIDATVYVPSVDLKFKNTTGHNILIQTVVDPNILRLTFFLYGTKDGREVTMTTPVVSNETPAPAPLYQDDPTLPKGTVKQIDFSANGAHVSFDRIVKQNGKEIINETFVSNYRPWQAVYLVGTM